jgi:hypothetical protein
LISGSTVALIQVISKWEPPHLSGNEIGSATQAQWDKVRAGGSKVSAVDPDGSFRTLADPSAAVLGAAALPAAAWRYRSRRRSHRS